MLSKVEISNYRGFKQYHMDGLAQVNLLVGKNNSGKTALLEGIQFLTSRGDPAVLAEVAHRRGEVIVTRPDTGVITDIAHFFHGHTINTETSTTFRGDNGYQPVVVRAFSHKEAKEDSSEPRAQRVSPTEFYLRISTGPPRPDRDEPRFLILPDGGVDLDSRYRRMGARQPRVRPHVRFVGPDSLNSIDIAQMWDEVTLTGQELNIAGAMKVLDPNVESLHILTGLFASGYFPARGGIVVGLKGQEGRTPLGSMGDGMRRMMALATSLAFTKEGCLFVDEIDTGLHYSVMADMWKLVVSKAVQSNAQVFATTHSWDCIEGLSLLCDREPDLISKVAVHKIDRAIPHSIPFAGEAIVRMAKADIDPR